MRKILRRRRQRDEPFNTVASLVADRERLMARCLRLAYELGGNERLEEEQRWVFDTIVGKRKEECGAAQD